MSKLAKVGVLILSLAGVAAFFGWAFYAMRGSGSWTGGSWVLLAMIVGGVLFTGALAGGLMWLAFYSARKGYDEDAAHWDPHQRP